ncbi:MAG TPA: CYTH domain-containing protein [Candidatus Limnocylindrales bacterium]
MRRAATGCASSWIPPPASGATSPRPDGLPRAAADDGAAADDEPTEVEFKFGVTDPRPLRALLRAPAPEALAGFEPVGPPERRDVTDRYLDTAVTGGRLETAGYRARLRGGHGGIELTVKRRGTYVGALSERLELKGAANRSRRPATWPPSVARDRLLAIAGPGPLVEVAALRQGRLVRLVRRGATEVELSLDALEGLDGERVAARRWEVEIELIGGDRAALEELASVIRRLPGVVDPEGSKLDFARAARGLPPRGRAL